MHRFARRSAVLVVLALNTLGCASIDELTVTLEAATWVEGTQRQPKLSGTLDFGAFDKIDLSQSPALRNRDVRRQDIDSATVSTFWLEVRDPANGQDLTFLDNIVIFVSADGVGQVPIAKGGPFPAGKRHVDLEPVKNDLAPYAAATSMKFLAQVNGKAPPQQTKIVAEVKLLVDVSVKGLLQ